MGQQSILPLRPKLHSSCGEDGRRMEGVVVVMKPLRLINTVLRSGFLRRAHVRRGAYWIGSQGTNSHETADKEKERERLFALRPSSTLYSLLGSTTLLYSTRLDSTLLYSLLYSLPYSTPCSMLHLISFFQ